MKIKNSLSTFLDQALILESNSLETIDRINNAVTSTEDTVTLTLTDPNDGNTLTYQIPSFGYLKTSIDRLDATLSSLTNVTEGSASSIRLSDGSYRKIIASKIPSEAPTITSVNNITNFDFKSNWFFEDLLNPCLYITWNFSDQIAPETEKIMIQRYILHCDTQRQKDVFNDLKGRTDIDYKEFLNLILTNKIKYTLDDEIKDLPPRSKRYYGTFSVIRIFNENAASGKIEKRYILDNLEFTDSRAGIENTRLLSVGDFVEINKTPSTTRFKVTFVDVSENKIGLQCVEGGERIQIGAKTLKISSSQDSDVSAEIPIGFDEREVMFVKAIDPDSHIPSVKWSPGVAFYSNELTYKDANGDTQTLQNFYQKNVIDFGQVLLSYAVDYYPSIREGITPDAPRLNYNNGEGDFKIVQINSQLTEDVDTVTFRSLVSDKAQVQSELENLTKEIANQKTIIQTTQYTSTNEKLLAQSALDTMIANQETLTSNYYSLVNTIKSKYISGETKSPKYRVRGFWDIPESKFSTSSGEQKIIKFKIRYRYLSASGNTNKEEEFSYLSGNVKVTGRFSNWNLTETELRPRIKTSTGWEWMKIDTADPDEVNMNQLDIPIQSGEQVEIQIRSVSEAGWPANPMMSDWSEPIIVSFSDFAELQADDLSEFIDQNKVDAAVANVANSFKSNNAHMSSSFYTNDKYFAHTAETITSGFLSSEQTPITLFDKLKDLQNQITQIIERINNVTGNLNVVLIDTSDNSSIYSLNEGTTTYINAGNYVDAIANLSDEQKKGAIITKTFYLDISSDVQSGLYLLSKLPGNRYSMCPSTISNNNENDVENDKNLYSMYDNIITPTTTSSTYYKEKGRYDLVPINLTNPEMIDYQVGSPNMYQSAQCRGQFVYSRFRNIGDTFDMYANTSVNGSGKFDENASFTGCECFATNVMYDGDAYKSEKESYILKEYNRMTGSNVTSLNDNYVDAYTVLFRLPKTWVKPETSNTTLLSNSKILTRLDNLVDSNEDDVDLSNQIKQANKIANRVKQSRVNDSTSYYIVPKLQTTYGFADLGRIKKIDFDGEGDLDDGSYLTTHKIGYEEKDRYSVGDPTCNSFLFLSPVNHNNIQVDGDTEMSSEYVNTNDSVRVPIIYQYRMSDYNGSIFGKPGLTSTDDIVRNTKFANIIGIDIWLDTSKDKPKQYDIVVYSTYTNTIDTNTSKYKTSTQTLIDSSVNVAKNLDKLVKQNSSTSKVLSGGGGGTARGSNSISRNVNLSPNEFDSMS